jgi:predicted nuclease of predicted toxin-antitoxin system
VESRERGVDPGDDVLLQWAMEEQRILVTMDRDFGELIFRGGAGHFGIIRLPDVPADQRIALMRQIMGAVPTAELERSIVTARRGLIRIARPS